MRLGPRAPLDLERLEATLLELLAIPSPSGFTEAAVRYLEGRLDAVGIAHERTRKGALRWTLPGRGDREPVLISAHVDTLGAVVKQVKASGRLQLRQIGSYAWSSIEGAEVTVHPEVGAPISGTALPVRASTHVHADEVDRQKRSDDSVEVRLDAAVRSDEDVRALGLEVGDVVAIASRPTRTASGFVKGRHLDNKACVAVALEVCEAMVRGGVEPPGDVHVFVSSHEEVGHGAAAGLPDGVAELLVLDMAPVGEGQRSSEHCVSLCVHDRAGLYDVPMGRRLRMLARRIGVDLRADVYPHYASDAAAAWRAGHDLPAALIGPGIDASHAHERTHRDALAATARLVAAYAEGVDRDADTGSSNPGGV